MAQRFQIKRSSIAGKRPGNEYLEPGELALNTNARDGGVYFEANDGTVLKAGPTYVGETQPYSEIGYGHGETWLDTATGSLKVWNEDDTRWMSAVSPSQGGASTVVYVGSDYPESTDSVNNDGSARPFSTINRACLEIARRSILQNQNDEPKNNRFTIVLLPGENIVYNDPGLSSLDFSGSNIVFTAQETISPETLTAFNPVSGGLPLPRGTSIVGLDPRKTKISPTFYPYWNVEGGEGSGEQHPRTNIISWTGNSFVSNVTFVDKIAEALVNRIDGEAEDPAIFHSLSPHAFRSLTKDGGAIVAGDKVSVTYSANVTASYFGTPSVSPTKSLYVEPLSPSTFRLLSEDGEVLARNQFPAEPSPGTEPPLFLTAKTQLSTHHRLSTLGYANSSQLNEFYEKVGRAFSDIDFAVSENTFNVVDTEVNIVSRFGQQPVIENNEAREAEALAFNVTVRSNYGMCGIHIDGEAIGGVQKAGATHFTSVSLQQDANVYEVYFSQEWRSLKEAYSLGTSTALGSVKNDDAIIWMAEKVELENIRFFYRTEVISSSGTSGLPEDFSDSRHFMLKATNGAIIEGSNVTAIGTAIGCWAQHGGEIKLSNSSSILGGQALRSEGFLGIGTGGGSLPPDRDFIVKGIRRPLALTYADALNGQNHRRFSLNVQIQSATENVITFTSEFDPESIAPYTLKPGTALWVQDFNNNVWMKAIIAEEGLHKDMRNLAVETEGNDFFGIDFSTLGAPFVRRFIDPRPQSHQTYQLWVENSGPFHRPPSPSSVLRLAEKPGQGKTDVLAYGRQLDPGINGGWNHVFSVVSASSKKDGDNPNTVQDSLVAASNDGNYYISLRLADGFGPWTQDNAEVNRQYSKGSFASYKGRSFYADRSQLQTGRETVPPDAAGTGWKLSKTADYLEKTGESYFPSQFRGARDLDAGLYSVDDEHFYARGISVSRENYGINKVIDWDSGEPDLGLADAEKKYVSSDYSDPHFAPSKKAVERLLSILGFDLDTLKETLSPQPWANRNFAVNLLPALTNQGYAMTKGEWPIEFNRSSVINATSHSWDKAGYLDYLNGLPNYQTSVLSKRQRFDALSSEAWGGVIFASGTNENGKFVLSSVSSVDASGNQLFTDSDLGDPLDMTMVRTYGTQEIYGEKSFTQDILPSNADGSVPSLGSPTDRWANVYTMDLHLQNERGNWTVIEEEDYLTLRNNKTGKLFKLVMEQIEG